MFTQIFRKFSFIWLAASAVTLGYAQTPPKIPPITPIPSFPPLTPVNSGQPSVKPLQISADDAARIGLQNQPNISIAVQQALAAIARVHEANSALLPQFSATSSYNYNTRLGSLGSSTSNPSSSSGGISDGFSNQIIAKQLLFDFNKTLDTARANAALALAANDSAAKVKSDTVFAIKTEYSLVQLAEQNLQTAQANLANRQAQYNLAENQLKYGTGAPSDLVTAATNLAESQSSLVSAQQTELNSKINLALAIGVDPRTPFDVEPFGSDSPKKLDPIELMKTALDQRPDLLSAKENLRAAGITISIQSKLSAPSLSLQSGISTRGTNNPFSTDSTFVGLTLSWTFFDSGFTASHVEEAKALQAQAKAQVTATVNLVVSDVNQAILAVQAAHERIQIEESEQKNGVLALDLAQGRYQAHVAPFLEVTTAQANLETANANLASAQQAYFLSLAQLDHAIGQIMKN